MNRYFFRKIFVTVLSLALSVALVALTFSVLTLFFFTSEGRLSGAIKRQSETIIAVIDEAVQPAEERLGLPEGCLEGAVTKDNINLITDTVAQNLLKSYTTDFFDNTHLFNLYMTRLKDYYEENGLNISDKERIDAASCAADLAANALYSSETVGAPVIKLVKSKTMLYALVIAFLLSLVCLVLISMLTRGRHRKFLYYGMGLMTAGYVNLGMTLWIRYKGYMNSVRFMHFDAYNSAFCELMGNVLKLAFIAGVLLAAVGFVMLVFNYNYFRKKNAEIKYSREHSNNIQEDFMPVDNPVSTRAPGEEFEKETMKINFD